MAACLHLMKLAVGIGTLAHLREIQAERAAREPPLRHRTRNFPRRRAEIVGGGSIYWVIGGLMCARQRILDVTADRWTDGSACAALLLDPALVAVTPRAMKPFQGWRYLPQAAAPADLSSADLARGAASLPEALLRDLRSLALL